MKLWLLSFLILSSGVSVWAAPAQVIIIRHAEKPDSGPKLSPKGYERANALPQFFANNPAAIRFGRPVAIYAAGVNTAANASDDTGHSIRSILTVVPLAKTLGLRIHEQYLKGDIEPLVKEIMNTRQYDGHTVVICWEHKMILPMVQEFGLSHPPDWPDEVFDRAWILSFSNNQISNFENVAQHLLPGDSP